MHIGILTGGGDCPGLNAAIRAIIRKGTFHYNDTFVGFLEGWKGVLENRTQKLTLENARGILPVGGTILRTSRTNPAKQSDGLTRCRLNLEANGIDALIAIGGDDTLGVAYKLYELGVSVIGVPKTIDNDLAGTDYCFGFDTAVGIAAEAIGRLHSTAEAHNRVFVVEVMGRDAGWIALYAGMAGGADVILVPEEPFNIETVVNVIQSRVKRGSYFSIVVVAEGARPADPVHGSGIVAGIERDEFGHARLGGIGEQVALEIGKRTKIDTRATVLGHIQRGGTPSAFDRVLATRYGIGAIDMAHRGEFGCMTALRANRFIAIPLCEVAGKNRTLGLDELEALRGINP
ncbi:MAG: ATP-dependent 6-phosphofructokinase [bacterium]|nr:ATP-dependent 6-phosphofructokinase [bacterium]